MQLDKTYARLTTLDEEEQLGYAYFLETNKYLDCLDLIYLQQQDNPRDFSVLKGTDADAYKKWLTSKLGDYPSAILREYLFISPGANSEVQRVPRYIDIFAHSHDFFEIVCTIRGQCLHQVDEETILVGQGDVTIIPPNVRHYLRTEPDSVTLNIKIRKTTFDSVFSVLMRSGTALSAYFAQTLYAKHYRNSLTFHCGQDAFLPELLLCMMTQQLEKKRHYNHMLDGLLAAFFPYLVQNYEHTIDFSSGDQGVDERMTAIENYVRQNYRTATLSGTAEHFHLSPAYLSTMIKKQTGFTFSSIIQKIRMEHATQLLSQTPMKVEQVCEHVGYQDPTQFIRTFKKYYSLTPLQYKNKYSPAKPVVLEQP
ncbi:MAG TPA: AraC family transcriptional regulator [Candidatus Onthovicinus excrementipullorum]|nr:AraC family transcriptional regulator [Candidatus Onthovicinus excrementipullorum]